MQNRHTISAANACNYCMLLVLSQCFYFYSAVLSSWISKQLHNNARTQVPSTSRNIVKAIINVISVLVALNSVTGG